LRAAYLRSCGLTCKCSRQAGAGLRSLRARASRWPNSGSVNLCGREDDRLQLICISLGGRQNPTDFASTSGIEGSLSRRVPGPGVSRVESIADIDTLITDTVAVLVVGLDDRKIEALGRLNALRRLYQEGPSHVTDKGLCALVRSPLEVLDLSGSVQLTDQGLKELRLIRSLRWLGLAGCGRLTGPGIAELRAALPQCEIEA
jgi:hypothetical protein